MGDLSIFITAQINTTTSEETINSQIEEISKSLQPLQLNVNINDEQLKSLSEQLALINDQIKSTGNASGSGIQLFNRAELEQDGAVLFETIDEAIAKYEQLGIVAQESLKFDPATGGLDNFILKLTDADGVVNKLKFDLISLDDGTKAFQLTGSSGIINENAIEKANYQIEQLQERLNAIKEQGIIPAEDIERVQTELDALNAGSLPVDFQRARDNLRSLESEVGNTSGKMSELASSMSKFAGWMISATLVMGLVNSVRTGIQSIIDMNSTLATLSITMNTTSQGLQNMSKQIQDVAISTGSSVQAVSDAVKVYANYGESVESIMAKTKAAIMLSNVSGLDTKQVTDSIHAILNEYNMGTQNIEQNSQHVADSLVAISKNMAVDFGNSFAD